MLKATDLRTARTATPATMANKAAPTAALTMTYVLERAGAAGLDEEGALLSEDPDPWREPPAPVDGGEDTWIEERGLVWA